jgi:hypothetical protein
MRHRRVLTIVVLTLFTIALQIALLQVIRTADAKTAGPEVVPVQFTDVTAAVGITKTHTRVINYYTVGQAWGDYDGDGLLDLYLTDSVGPNVLFKNMGATFQPSPLAATVALTDATSGGAIFTDYDNDGWIDLYILNKGSNVLYRNNNGTEFVDVTAFAGVGDMGKGETASWGDYDQDGHLDLYVANWACDTCDLDENVEGNRDRLYHSNGNGTFSDVTMSLGMTQTVGAGFVASFVDYDNDADLDIYLVNDRHKGPNVNILWRNDGAGCGEWCWTDVSEEAGADTEVAGMGLAVHDYDHDGDLDFYFSNGGPAKLLQNQTSQGNPIFIEVGSLAGVDYDAISWGTVALDYDNDGWIDLYLTIDNDFPGFVNYLARNLGNGEFESVANAAGAPSSAKSMGVAYADYDNDGWVDLLVGNYNTGYQLYRNQGSPDTGHSWLKIKLVGDGPINRAAIGSRVYVHTNDGETQLMELKSGSSLGAGNDLALHFGLGSAEIVSVTVRWPNGVEQTYYDAPLNSTWTLTYTPPVFADVTSSAGISAPHSQDELGTGQVFVDFDNDGWLDLFLTNQLGPNQLYRNNGDGTFALSPLSAQLAITDSLSLGANAADYDNDGWRDIFVTVWGSPNALFHNDGGTGFTNVSASAGIINDGPSEGSAWGDYDNDGFLDLYVANYSCDTCGVSLPDQLYHNNGDGTFSDFSNLLDLGERSKLGFLASFADYDNDGDADLYVINDKLQGNTLWRNDGAGCGGWCFTDVSVSAGADTRVFGMGLATGDYDNDLDLDFYFTNIGPMVLLQNQTSQGSPEFVDVAPAVGVDRDTVGWGAIFFDYDNDSWLDLYFSAMASDNMNRLYHNEQDGTFSDVTAISGASEPLNSIGVSYADYDQDGLLDLIVGQFDTEYRLYRNMGSENRAANNWLRVKLVGAAPINRDAIGARVYLTTSEGLTLMQEVKSGSSFGAGSDLALHFGLGTATVTDLTVRWPNGEEDTYTDVPLNQQWQLTYSSADLEFAPDYAFVADPNTTVTRTHWLTNSGNTTDTITLTVASELGWTTVDPMSVVLAAGASAEITASFTVPNIIEITETALITATSSLNSAVSATVTDTVTVDSPTVGVTLVASEQIEAEPNTTRSITHTLTNTGTWTDTFAITFDSSMGWASVAPIEVTLASGVSAEITATFTVPNVIESAETAVITATSTLDDAVSATVIDIVTVGSPTAGVSLSPGQDIDAEPGTVHIITHTITNTGTWLDTFTISADSSEGWTVVEPVSLLLDAGASAEITATVTVPNVIDTTETVMIMATSSLDNAVTATVTDTVSVGSPEVGVNVSPAQHIDVEPGTTNIITHSITNTGTWTDTFAVMFDSSQGWTTVAPITVLLAAGEESVLTVEIVVPALATGTETVTITVSSTLDPSVTATVIDSAETMIPDHSSKVFLPLILK